MRAKAHAEIKPTQTACSFNTPHVGITLVAQAVTKNIIKYLNKLFTTEIFYNPS